MFSDRSVKSEKFSQQFNSGTELLGVDSAVREVRRVAFGEGIRCRGFEILDGFLEMFESLREFRG